MARPFLRNRFFGLVLNRHPGARRVGRRDARPRDHLSPHKRKRTSPRPSFPARRTISTSGSRPGRVTTCGGTLLRDFSQNPGAPVSETSAAHSPRRFAGRRKPGLSPRSVGYHHSEVRIFPEGPTATRRVPFQATEERLLSPACTWVQFSPRSAERIVMPLPTATSVVPVQATSCRSPPVLESGSGAKGKVWRGLAHDTPSTDRMT